MLTLRKELDLSVAFTTFWTRQVQQLDMKRQAHLLRYQVLQQLLRYDNIFIVCDLDVHLHKTNARKRVAAKIKENFTFAFALARIVGKRAVVIRLKCLLVFNVDCCLRLQPVATLSLSWRRATTMWSWLCWIDWLHWKRYLRTKGCFRSEWVKCL